MSAAFFSAILVSGVTTSMILTHQPTQARRTHYGLSKVSTIPDAKLRSIIETAVKHTPSPFNSQSARVVLLLGKESDKLWDIVQTGFVKTLGSNGKAPKQIQRGQ
jgi:predicted oxidoreductase (fatty acid repression mutant protein)